MGCGAQALGLSGETPEGAPKSVSVLAAVGEERVRGAVLAAHAAGVAAALDYLENVPTLFLRGLVEAVR